ncbi:hypothetical protein RHGRI_033332 [Rhododendron griersonianum]|uniref:Serine/threonine protein phosphatase 2A regulatory subunit n=1 Tax=Rhododendron griersonianum TaxID=479676 RepID=A0AAV6I0I9_9ERIC|nr:hypothetical protein RHGRI_033332 [Rhododendron griersonianum]KAG5520711.1 hypothetical protein RHGRI_033332 [Rhododendron griersonianum]
MFKHILSKLPKKSSKSSKNQEVHGAFTPVIDNSISSKSSDIGSKKLGNPINTSLATLYSASNIGQNQVDKLSVGASSKLNGTSVATYEALPSFRDVPGSQKENLFIRKLKMCCVVFDFSDATKNLKEKEIKRQTLLELVDYITTVNGKFVETVMEEAIKMVSANIFRSFTTQPCENKVLGAYDLEEEEPLMDPAWPHLQIVYEFLLRFVASPETDAKSAKKYIDHFFVLNLLDLFDSEDPREREYLKTILHRVYGKFMVHRPFIRKSMNNIFYTFIFETEKHNGIAELLDILGSIINGFALPLKEEHKLFLVRALIPLHEPRCLAMYYQQLSYCISQFVEKDCKLSDGVIRGLLKYWPVTNSSKEVMFLSELEEVLEATQLPEFQRCMMPLFRQIARCLNSLHFQVCEGGGGSELLHGARMYVDQFGEDEVIILIETVVVTQGRFGDGIVGAVKLVAERALFLWNNDHIYNLIQQNRDVILPIIFPALERNARGHWNQTVHSSTLNVRKIFFDLDPELFKECMLKFQEDEIKEEEVKARREATWRQLEGIAWKKAVTNEAVLLPL